MNQMTGIEADAVKGIADAVVDTFVKLAPGNANPDLLIPRDNRLKIGGGKLIDVILNACRKLLRVFDGKARAAGQRAPERNADRKAVALRDPIQAGTDHAEDGARSRREECIRRSRQTV